MPFILTLYLYFQLIHSRFPMVKQHDINNETLNNNNNNNKSYLEWEKIIHQPFNEYEW